MQNYGNMVVVKNTRIFVPLAILIIIIGLIFTLAVFKALFKVHSSPTTTTSTNKTTQADDINVSESNIYFQGPITNLPNAPQYTWVSPKDSNGKEMNAINVYWIQEKETEGNDTCTLYDSSSGKIYATRYKTNGSFSGRSAGSMFYVNDTIKQDVSLKLLDSTCFKTQTS